MKSNMNVVFIVCLHLTCPISNHNDYEFKIYDYTRKEGHL